MKIPTPWGVEMEPHHVIECVKCGHEIEGVYPFEFDESLTCPECGTQFQSSSTNHHKLRYDFPVDISPQLECTIRKEFYSYLKSQGLPVKASDLKVIHG